MKNRFISFLAVIILSATLVSTPVFAQPNDINGNATGTPDGTTATTDPDTNNNNGTAGDNTAPDAGTSSEPGHNGPPHPDGTTSGMPPPPHISDDNPDRNNDGIVDEFEKCAFIEKLDEEHCRKKMEENEWRNEDGEGHDRDWDEDDRDWDEDDRDWDEDERETDDADRNHDGKIDDFEECAFIKGFGEDDCRKKMKMDERHEGREGPRDRRHDEWGDEDDWDEDGEWSDEEWDIDFDNYEEKDYEKKFDPDQNHDGVVDSFEKAFAECMKKTDMLFDFCDKKLRNFPRPKQHKMHGKMREWKNWESDDFMNKMDDEDFDDFMKEFDPSVFHEFDEKEFDDFKPEFLNEFLEHDPDKFRRMDPRMLEHMEEDIDDFDPRMFEHMKQFGRHIDPRMFEHVEDDKFFNNFDPEFLNHVDIDEIPDELFNKIDPSKFNEIDPYLLEKMRENAPERFKEIPDEVRKAAELMMEDIPEDLLGEFGFEGEEAKRVKKLMEAVNNRKREKIMPILKKIDEKMREDMMELQEDFEDEVGNFIEYLPHVPEKHREKFVEHKKEFLEDMKRMDEEFAKIKGKIDQEMEKLIEKFETEVAAYNFTGDSAEKLKKHINEFLKNAPKMPPREIKRRIKMLHEKMERLKEDAKYEKFEAGIIPFKDTDDNQWFTPFVSESVKDGVISGYKDMNGNPLGEFKPANKVTVSEAIKMTLGNAGHKEEKGETTYKNANDHWVQGWAKTAEDKNITLSMDEDFNRQATRAEVLRWTIESYGIVPPKAEKSSFPDVSKTHKHLDFIEYGKEMGIVSGDDTGKFRADDPIVRAEVSKVLQKAKEVFKK